MLKKRQNQVFPNKEAVILAVGEHLRIRLQDKMKERELLLHGTNEVGNLAPEDLHANITQADIVRREIEVLKNLLIAYENKKGDWKLSRSEVVEGALFCIQEPTFSRWILLLPKEFSNQGVQVADIDVCVCSFAAPKIQKMRGLRPGESYSFRNSSGEILAVM